MKKTGSLLLMLMLLSIFTIQAQNKSSLGIKIGMHSTKLSVPLEGEDTDYLSGVHVGAFYSMEFGKCRLQPGLIYVRRGGSKTVQNVAAIVTTQKIEQRSKLNYVEIPLELSYKIVEFEKCNIRLSAEPYLGFALSGKFKSGDEETMIKIGEENGAINGDLRDKNYGVRVGASLQFGMFEPYAGYDIGLGDVIYGPSVAYSNGLYFGLALHL